MPNPDKSLGGMLGDVVAFYALIRSRLDDLGIDIATRSVSHVAYRCETFREYLSIRSALETFAVANVESVWNERPISKVLLSEPLILAPNASTELVELIPPFHQPGTRLGLEHLGFSVGEDIAKFGRDPYAIEFEDGTHAKFYRTSLRELCEDDGLVFDRVIHADWSYENLDAGPYD